MSVRETMRGHHERQSATPTDAMITDDSTTKKLAAFIQFKVGDGRLFDNICMKVARAIIGDQISRSEIDQLLDRIETGRKAAGDEKIDHPGPYFMASIKRIFKDAGVPWR